MSSSLYKLQNGEILGHILDMFVLLHLKLSKGGNSDRGEIAAEWGTLFL